MDEVDGMSAGDRGGVADLIQTIHKSKVPIVAICNDKYNQKLKSLRNHCLELEYRCAPPPPARPPYPVPLLPFCGCHRQPAWGSWSQVHVPRPQQVLVHCACANSETTGARGCASGSRRRNR